MIFELRLDNIKLFKQLTKKIMNMNNYVTIRCDEDGLKLRLYDSRHTSYINALFEMDAFTVYDLEDVTSFTVDTKELYEVTQKCVDNITFTLADDELILISYPNHESGFKKTFKLKLLDDNINYPSHRLIDDSESVDIPFRVLKSMITDASITDSQVIVSLKDNKLILYSEGYFVDNIDEYILDSSIKKDCASYFLYDELYNLIDSINYDYNVKLIINDNDPLKLIIDDFTEYIKIEMIIMNVNNNYE